MTTSKHISKDSKPVVSLATYFMVSLLTIVGGAALSIKALVGSIPPGWLLLGLPSVLFGFMFAEVHGHHEL